jgi:hypothetical protein
MYSIQNSFAITKGCVTNSTSAHGVMQPPNLNVDTQLTAPLIESPHPIYVFDHSYDQNSGPEFIPSPPTRSCNVCSCGCICSLICILVVAIIAYGAWWLLAGGGIAYLFSSLASYIGNGVAGIFTSGASSAGDVISSAASNAGDGFTSAFGG